LISKRIGLSVLHQPFLTPKENTMSKILLIGASGTIGQAVQANLGARHDVITVGRSSGEHRADLSQPGSVVKLFEAVGKVDAIVSTAGNLHFGPLAEMTAEQFNLGLQDKLLGQVQLALVGQKYLNDGGSITLTAGILSIEPIRNGANATAVNAAIEGFVAAAAIELPRGLRINAVSPTILTESVGGVRAVLPGVRHGVCRARRARLPAQRGRGADRAGVPGSVSQTTWI
jgi:NAD(P)-dependent dehydrogenase (short-subunit alcohol dehydrogenase family)